MAQLAFGVAGAAIGHSIGGGYAGLGFAAATTIYSLLNPPDDIIQEGQRPNTQLTTTSAYGLPRPIKFGTIPIAGNIIDGSSVYKTRHESKQDSGGKGGLFGGGQDVVTVTWTLSVDLAIGLGEGEIENILKIYANDKLIYDVSPNAIIIRPNWLNMQIYKGTEDQLPDPTLQVLHGDDTPAYRGEAYVVFTRFELEQFNNQIPAFRFVVATKSTTQVSIVTKNFSTGNIGALLHDRNANLIYYLANGQEDIRCGYIYDPYNENEVVSLRWPTGVTQFDQGGGACLCSLPTLANGIRIQSGPNAHLVFPVDDDDLAVFDSKTGVYLGKVSTDINDGANSKPITADERDGIVYRLNGETFKSLITSWSLFLDQNDSLNPIKAVNRGNVPYPIANRDGNNEWSWFIEQSYPEGTDRNGRVLAGAIDNVTGDKYICIIDSKDNIVDQLKLANEYNTFSIFCYDFLQDYFWVLGESSQNIGTTLFQAYDASLNVAVSINWTTAPYVGLYSGSENFLTFDGSNSSLWFYNASTDILYQWSVISHEFLEEWTNIPSGQLGTYPRHIYINSTNSIWRRKGNGELDIYRLNRGSDDGITLDQIINRLCNRATLDPAQYDTSQLSSTNVAGYKIERNGNIKQAISPLQQTYLFDGIDKVDQISFEFRGKPVEAIISQDDLGVSKTQNSNQEFITIRRKMDLDLPKKVEVTYYNKNVDYEQNTQIARRIASYVEENSIRYSLPVVLNDNQGIQLADKILHIAYIEREVYEIDINPKWQYLVSGDVLDVQYNNKTFTGRIIQKSFQDGIVKLTLTKEDSSIINSSLVGGSPPDRSIGVDYNPLMQSIYLDIPLLLEANNNAGFYVSACAMDESWDGGNIYKSPDGSSFNYIATILTQSIIGSTDQALLTTLNHNLWDRTTKLIVFMRCGELSSVTETQALRGENAICLGVNGRWEVINFVNATLISEGVYEIDTFLRGRLGTEWSINTHQLGDTLCFLSTDDLSYISDSLSNLNVPFIYRSISLGENLYGDRAIDQNHINTGVCLKPYAPATFEGIKNPTTLDIEFKLRPRSRFLWRDYWSGIPSDPNNFEIDIELPDTSLKTVTITNDTSYIYTRADQISDGFPSTDIFVTDAFCYHISDSVGRGYQASTRIGVGPLESPYVLYAATLDPIGIWQYNEPSSETFFKDTLNVYSDNPYFNSVTLEQASLLESGYGTSVRFTDTGGTFSPVINPIASSGPFNMLNFSYSIIFRFEELGTEQFFTTPVVVWVDGFENYCRLRVELDGTLRVEYHNMDGNFQYLDYGIISVGTTYHIVVTFKNSTWGTTETNNLKIYVNGSLGAEGSMLAPTVFHETDVIRIGSADSGISSPQSDDHLQQMRFLFSRELTALEVANLYSLRT